MHKLGRYLPIVALALIASGCFSGEATGGTRSTGGGKLSDLDGVALLVQTTPSGYATTWRTTSKVDLQCGQSQTTHTADSTVCQAVIYYLSHQPQPPCLPHGPVPRRVVIVESLEGRMRQTVMGPLCNPPARLAEATRRIAVAAFTHEARTAGLDADRSRSS